MDLTWDELKKEVTLAVESEVRFPPPNMFCSYTCCTQYCDGWVRLNELQSDPRPYFVLCLSKGVM